MPIGQLQRVALARNQHALLVLRLRRRAPVVKGRLSAYAPGTELRSHHLQSAANASSFSSAQRGSQKADAELAIASRVVVANGRVANAGRRAGAAKPQNPAAKSAILSYIPEPLCFSMSCISGVRFDLGNPAERCTAAGD
ncbi:hypothetical protein L1887_58353 [Cichorium endivia]|nr:hypothetical protein L1887_58353 [Cichorium endivia]